MMTKAEQLAEIAAGLEADGVTAHLRATATQLVPGDGDPDAELLFIGEAPGAKEDAVGKPFVGAAGRLLDQMLESIGLDRSRVFVTNIVKYRPPDNRDPTPEEIKVSIPYLERQVAVIRPKLIVFLGRHAMSVFLPELKISQAHGKPVRKGGQVYLPLFHPAAALYNPGQRQLLFDDFARIPAILAKLNH